MATDNFDATAFRPKMPWHERAKLIREHFPRSASVDWQKVFQDDPAVMGRILGDVFKADMAEPGRPGKRPSLDPGVAAHKLRQFSQDDYTILPFHRALKVLQGQRSLRHFARTTGLPKSTLDRLLKGERRPDLDTIEQIAGSLGKRPSYFVEYRVGYVTAVISHYLEWAPEASVVQFNRIKGNYERVGS